MELAVELLAKLLENQAVHISFPELNITPRDLLESASYQALCQIQNILRDDSLSDPECLRQIEAAVRCFETLGSDGGGRHCPPHLPETLLFSLDIFPAIGYNGDHKRDFTGRNDR